MPRLKSLHFDSVGEFVERSLHAVQTRGVGEDYKAPEPSDWYGTKSFEEAQRLLTKGWPEGAEKVASLRDRLSCVVSAAKQARAAAVAYGVEGLWVDEGRIVTGEPECCGYETLGEDAGAHVVALRYNAAVSGSVKPEAITARGVAVLTAIDLIESCGTRCEVIYAQGTQARGGGNLECNVVAKSADQPVDLDRLAFVLTHPSFFRRFGFAFCEGHGHPTQGTRPCGLSDHGNRPGVVEISEVCTASGLAGEELAANVLAIAKACGVDLGDDVTAEILAGVAT
jgi:hypothetical protein